MREQAWDGDLHSPVPVAWVHYRQLDDRFTIDPECSFGCDESLMVDDRMPYIPARPEPHHTTVTGHARRHGA
ncbi:hypothetical protein [Nonomuraea sp. NPDC049684]|uniref:hypothetical protein n=1 Tax=unclassified Nonomuraea TaxID=2593643 RepID=UPI0037B717F1